MIFLAWSMLGGLAAVAIPILIHLFKRRSARRVDWGAMDFLLGSVVRRSRLMMIEELLLLAVRCLLIVALVLTMARPLIPIGAKGPWLLVLPLLGGGGAALAAATVISSRVRRRNTLFGLGLVLLAAGLLVSIGERWRQLGRWSGGGQNDVALVLDGSGSMNLRQDGRMAFERVIAEAHALLNALPAGDGVSLVLAGSSPIVLTPVPIADRRRLHALLDPLQPGAGPLAVVESLQAAATSLAQGSRPYKKIVLLTDAQSVGWNAKSEADWQALARSLQSLTPDRKAGAAEPGKRPPVPILCRTLALKDGYRNVAVSAIRFTRRAIGPDRPVGIEVAVVNTGLNPVGAFPVRLDVDGEREPFLLSAGPLEPGASETVSFRYRFRPAPGLGAMRGVTARADTADDLPQDNTSAAVAAFSERLPVLVVDGNPGAPLAQRAAGFLATALAPFGYSTNAAAGSGTNAAPALAPFIDPQVISAARLTKDRDLAPYRVIVLADVPRLTEELAGRIAAYVEGGGSLLVAAGSRCRPEFYNEWRGSDGEPVLGAQLGAYGVRGEKEAPARIRLTDLQHAGLAVVQDEKQSDLGEAAIRAYWQLSPAGGARAGGWFDAGDVLLVERRLGAGRVITLAAPLDSVAGNLPTLRSFVPLAHGLVCDLAAAPEAERLNTPAGNRLSLRLPAATQAAPAALKAGLQGDYYAGNDFGQLGVTRVDGAVNFTWNGSPDGSVPPGPFSVRWTGSLRARFSEPYTFHLRGDDRARLWIDDQPLVTALLTEQSGKIDLATNRAYDIRVELVGLTVPNAVRLEWSSPSQVREVVPPACLQAQRPAAARARSGGDAVLTGPDRNEYPAAIRQERDAPVVSLERPLAPGLYRLRLPASVADRCGALGDALGRLPVAVAADAEEGRFVPLQPEELEAIGRHVDLVRVESPESLIGALTGNVPGREITRHLAAAVLLLALLEVALTRWIAAMRRTGALAAAPGAATRGRAPA